MIYIRKTTPVEAVKWTGGFSKWKEIKEKFPQMEVVSEYFHESNNQCTGIRIKSCTSMSKVHIGDYIINDNGHFYPCRAEYFEKNFEEY